MTRVEKETKGNVRAFNLFDEFLKKNIYCDDFAVTYGKSGNYPVKANIRLYNSTQKYKNRPVYVFEIGYPNITNDATFNSLIELVSDHIRLVKERE